MKTLRFGVAIALIAAFALVSGTLSPAVAGAGCCARAKTEKASCGSAEKVGAHVGATAESNAKKAVAVLEALESGDASVIETHVSADTYTQHNLAFPDGRQALVDAINAGMLEGTKVDVKRVFEDGDYVVTHSEYMLFGARQVGFDIFRFEDGLVVEHWDNLQAFAPPNPSERTMLDGATEATTLELTDKHRKFVGSFIEDVLIGGDFDGLSWYFDHDAYIQHSPAIGDGFSTLLAAVGSGELTMVYEKLHGVHAQGDFVLTIAEGELDGAPVAFYDLFRMDEGFIAEHWDVVQAIPAESEWANENGKF